MSKRLIIVLPTKLNAWLAREVESGGYGTPSEYIRHLLRKAQVEWTTDAIDAAIIQGEKSGRPVSMNARSWDAIKKRSRARAARIQGSGSNRRKSV